MNQKDTNLRQSSGSYNHEKDRHHLVNNKYYIRLLFHMAHIDEEKRTTNKDIRICSTQVPSETM